MDQLIKVPEQFVGKVFVKFTEKEKTAFLVSRSMSKMAFVLNLDTFEEDALGLLSLLAVGGFQKFNSIFEFLLNFGWTPPRKTPSPSNKRRQDKMTLDLKLISLIEKSFNPEATGKQFTLTFQNELDAIEFESTIFELYQLRDEEIRRERRNALDVKDTFKVLSYKFSKDPIPRSIAGGYMDDPTDTSPDPLD